MILALFALLGVPLWLILGAVAAVAWSRRTFRKQPSTFRAKIRLVQGHSADFGTKWHRMYGRWIHDVLLINRGVALLRIIPLGIAEVEEKKDARAAQDVCVRSEEAVVFRIRTDEGAILELATQETAGINPARHLEKELADLDADARKLRASTVRP